MVSPKPSRFQSTLPARGATGLPGQARISQPISIHAPRTGSDGVDCRNAKLDAENFNPRSPHGERRTHGMQWHVWTTTFQSTLPARGATRPALYTAIVKAFISIHAPRTGSDDVALLAAEADADFNPRSPHGERPRLELRHNDGVTISIHAPRTGSDANHQNIGGRQSISIHAPRTGSDRAPWHRLCGVGFQSTLPARGATPSTDAQKCAQ